MTIPLPLEDDEGDWCECCKKIQPLRDNRVCAVCGHGYDDCYDDTLIDEPINIEPTQTFKATLFVKKVTYL